PVRWISVTASALAETVMHQREHGGECRIAVGTGDAEIKHRPLRGLDPHHLHGALGVRPWSVRRERNFNLRGKALGALRELDRWSRMKTDRIDEDRRSRKWHKSFGRPAGVDIMHRIPPHCAGLPLATNHPRIRSPRS